MHVSSVVIRLRIKDAVFLLLQRGYKNFDPNFCRGRGDVQRKRKIAVFLSGTFEEAKRLK